MNRLIILLAGAFLALCTACSEHHEASHATVTPSVVISVKMPEEVDSYHHHEHSPKQKPLALDLAPHVHGVAQMHLTMDSTQLTILLTLSGMDTLGFERAVGNPDEQALLNKTLAYLQSPDTLFALPTAAGCRLMAGAVETAFIGTQMNQSHPPHRHLGFVSHYQWHCRSPEQLTAISVGVFSYFPQVQKISAQWVLHNKQGAAELTGENAVLSTK